MIKARLIVVALIGTPLKELFNHEGPHNTYRTLWEGWRESAGPKELRRFGAGTENPELLGRDGFRELKAVSIWDPKPYL